MHDTPIRAWLRNLDANRRAVAEADLHREFEEPVPRSMFANPWFWVSALVGALAWSAVALLP